ncbi:hypothetical protein OHB49_43885 (plasmid) [Streptomyces sp. NBC_01717]|uniref:hypothetical protein n=1 Tax=Streptomyces sp. NBC_01717 TaxID=2975918 RepID=UPI002E30F3E0|nr:hypothetical protein [Streptomyces sp. NBC_01717]
MSEEDDAIVLQLADPPNCPRCGGPGPVSAQFSHSWTNSSGEERAGDTTALVSLEGWYSGQIPAPVDTWIIEGATGNQRQELPGTQLWVMALLTAQSAEKMDLQQWEPCRGAQRTQAA